MKATKIIFLLVLPMMFLSACVSSDTANSDTVKQSEIYQSYSVSYDAGDVELSATAYFRFGGSGGTTLLLSKPSNITFDGLEMSMGKSMFTGSYYETHLQNTFRGTYVFKFTDTEKKTYTNTAAINAIEVGEYADEGSKKKGFSIGFNDKAIANGEKVTLTIEDGNHNTRTITSDLVGTTSVEVKPADLKDFVTGDANIYFTREMNSSLTEATHLGGSMDISYISKKKGIKIIE